jgi:hypothetical protein
MLVRRLAIANLILLVIVVALFLIAIGQRSQPTDIELTASLVLQTGVWNDIPASLIQTQTASADMIAATHAAETATRAPRPDPLLLTASAIARP